MNIQNIKCRARKIIVSLARFIDMLFVMTSAFVIAFFHWHMLFSEEPALLFSVSKCFFNFSNLVNARNPMIEDLPINAELKRFISDF